MDDLSWRPAHHPQTVFRIIDDEAVIVLPESGKVGVLNEVGSRVWEVADGQRTVRNIAQLLTAEFDVSLEQALKDTLEFVRDLIDKEMLILSSESPTERT